MAVLGIDLGRANCSAVVQRNDSSGRLTLHVEPVVTLTTKNEWLVGEEARQVAAANGGEAVWDLLRLQGRRMSDFTTTELGTWPFRLVQGTAGKALVEFQASPSRLRSVFTPEELLAVLFAHVRRLAEQQCNCVIEDAVLTMPASLHYTQRQSLRDACSMAGLTARRLVVSSTAASLAFSTGGDEDLADQLILVVDFGAGSVDVSLVAKSSPNVVEVKAAIGDSTIGGVTLTERIAGHLLRGTNISAVDRTQKTHNRMRRASQLAKKILSKSCVAAVQLQLDSGPFSGSITRSEFEAACSDCWDRIAELVQIVLDEGSVASDQVNCVVLCGGSVVIPAVQTLMKRLLPAAEMKIQASDDLPAHGAAVLAASLATEELLLELADVMHLAVGVQRVGAKEITELVAANSRVPARGENLFFAGCHVPELVYRVFEGRNLRQAAHAQAQTQLNMHCVGAIHSLKSPLASSTSPAQLISKLTISAEVDMDLQVSVSIMDLATRQPTRTTFHGDATTLPKATLDRVRAELEAFFGGHRVQLLQDGDKTPDERAANLASGTCDDQPYLATELHQYAQQLRSMVQAKTLRVAISTADEQLLTNKIDEVLEWLHSTEQRNANESPPITNNSDHTDESSNTPSPPPLPQQQQQQQQHATNNETIRARLQALRRLHWGVAASAALAQLRSLDY